MTMQLLQAYVRPQLASRVVQTLIDEGCGDLAITECRRVVGGLEEAEIEYSVQIGQKIEMMIRLETVGPAERVATWVQIIRERGATRRHGDGLVVVLEVAGYVHLSGMPPEVGRGLSEEEQSP